MKTQRSRNKREITPALSIFYDEIAVNLSRYRLLTEKGELKEEGWRAVAVVGGTNIGEIILTAETLPEVLAALGAALAETA